MVQACIRVDDNGVQKKTTWELKLTEVSRVTPALVYWTSKQIADQYRTGGGTLVTWESTFDTDRDWWLRILNMEPFPGGGTLPQAMMECLIHERGFPCGHDRKERVFPQPPGYVKWQDKLRYFKACVG